MKPAFAFIFLLLVSTVFSTISRYPQIRRRDAGGLLVPSNYRRKSNMIGSGGFCKVFKGFHEDHVDHAVALRACKYKSVNPHARFAHECRLHKISQHENVLKLIDCFQGVDDYYLFVVEYMEGGDLSERLTKLRDGKKCLPEHIVQHVFRELLNGVEYLHNNGIIHRDLKPGNILIGPGAVKISDFGLADKLGESQSVFTGCTKCGTARYRAPEMETGVHTFGADVYSLGVILYEMVTCRLFPKEYSKASKTRIIASLMDHKTRPNLIALIVGMTDQDPTKRLTIRQVRESSYVIEDIPSSLGDSGGNDIFNY